MNSQNVVILSGRITKDFSFIKNKEGKEFRAQTSIAVRRHFKTSDGKYPTSFFTVKITGEKRMNTARLYKKGDAVTLSGELVSESWKDADGNSHSSVYIDIDDISFQDGNKKDSGSENSNSNQAPQEVDNTSENDLPDAADGEEYPF